MRPMLRVLFLWALVSMTALSSIATAQQEAEETDEEQQEANEGPSLIDQLPAFSGLFEEHRHQVVSVRTELAVAPDEIPPFFDGVPGEPSRGEGSGFIVDSDGLAITNWHVVADAQSVEVITADASSLSARVIGADPSTDIALLDIDSPEPMIPAQLGSADDITPGEWVVAIGSPFGLEQSVTVGVLSAKGRQIGLGPYDDFLQTDASINPGNSGGPLYNLAGEVVGVNTAIIPHGGGVGFAVPIDTVRRILPQLRDQGHVVRGFIGAGIQDLSRDLAETFGLQPRDGVLIRSVEPDQPAAEAGLREGDVITHVGDTRTEDTPSLLRRIAELQPGDAVDIDLLRDGESQTVELIVDERPTPDQERLERTLQPDPYQPGRLGVVVRPLRRDIAQQHRLPANTGVFVDRVEAGSPASGVLRPGDVLLRIDGVEISRPEQVPDALQRQPAGEPIRIFLSREGERHFVAVRLVAE